LQFGSFNSGFYSVSLATGAATLIGSIGIGFHIRGLAIAPPADKLAGLTTTNELVQFSSSAPGTILSGPTAIIGLESGESIIGIDYRASNGALYGLSNQGRIYSIQAANGVATLASTLSQSITGTAHGFGVSPVLDAARIVGDDDQNSRADLDTGAVSPDIPLAYAGTDPNSAANPSVVAAAFTNSFAGASTTTLFGIDSGLDILVTQSPPNDGTLNTVGALGVNTSSIAGFDIEATINVAYAALEVGGSSGLYLINLSTGSATSLGAIGTSQHIRGLAVIPAGSAMIGVTTSNSLIRFSSTSPESLLGAGTPITGLAGGDQIMSIDYRPADAVLYGLSSQSRLYTISATSGAATLVGDLSQLMSGNGFGFDFNPTSDRARAVSDSDQNFRVNPDTATVTADDLLVYTGGDPNFGTNPSIVASAYTNSVAGATVTTLYGIDSALNTLVIQNPPNIGSLTTVGVLGVDVTFVSGFDIEPFANIALAAFQPGGAPSSLYSINLATGKATALGPIGSSLEVRGLAVMPAGVVELSSASFNTNEYPGVAAVTLTRTGGSEGSVMVRIATTDGTATTPADYTVPAPYASFVSGQTSRTVLIPIVNDATPETSETLSVALSAGSGAVLGTEDAATLTIIDNDNPIAAPTGVTATATSTIAVDVQWNVVGAADHYDVYRDSGSGLAYAGTTATTSFSDSGLSPNKAYLYLVRAIGPGAESSPDSAADLATTILFEDNPLVAGASPIRTVHVTQLRTAVNAARSLAGIGSFTFTDPSLTGLTIKAVHLTELRSALDTARSSLALSAANYTNVLTPGTSLVRALDVTEIRNGAQ